MYIDCSIDWEIDIDEEISNELVHICEDMKHNCIEYIYIFTACMISLIHPMV